MRSEELHDQLVGAGYDVELTLIDDSHLASGFEFEVGFDRVVEVAVDVANG